MRVEAGTIAKKSMKDILNTGIFGYISHIENVQLGFKDGEFIKKNSFFSTDKEKRDELELLLNSIRKQEYSVGVRLEVIAKNMLISAFFFACVNAEISKVMMGGIGAVKAV